MSVPPPRPPAATIPIEIPADLRPAYANLVRIAHSSTDFVLDFARFLPGDAKAPIEARIIMSPLAAKLMLKALSENMARYEGMFGVINVPSGSQSSLAEHLFRPFQPPTEPPQGGAPPEPPAEPK
jgi:hypothetical protein